MYTILSCTSGKLPWLKFNFTHADAIDSKFYPVGDATEALITELLTANTENTKYL